MRWIRDIIVVDAYNWYRRDRLILSIEINVPNAYGENWVNIENKKRPEKNK